MPERALVRWLVISVGLSAILAVLFNFGLRALSVAGQRVGRRPAALTEVTRPTPRSYPHDRKSSRLQDCFGDTSHMMGVTTKSVGRASLRVLQRGAFEGEAMKRGEYLVAFSAWS